MQKTNIIRDFLEDIEEEPAPRYALHVYCILVACLSSPALSPPSYYLLPILTVLNND